MAGVGGQVDGGRELSQVEQSQPLLGSLIRRILNGVNTLATNTATSATGENQAPKPPSSVSVTTSGELAHISISHPGELQRGVQYFSEIHSDDPATAGMPIIYHHGSSRTPPPINLPTLRPNPAGGAGIPINYSVQSYAQYHSSQPSAPVAARLVGSTGATTFQMGGTTVMSLLPGTGSGTAANTGQQTGWGLGKTQKRQS